MKRFRQMVKHLARYDHLPDYRVVYDEVSDQITFHNRESWWDKHPQVADDSGDLPSLPRRAYDEGRAAAPGYVIYQLEQQWREWWASSGKPSIDNPAAAFVGFCRSRHQRAPLRRAS
jgi:hypothetical protein